MVYPDADTLWSRHKTFCYPQVPGFLELWVQLQSLSSGERWVGFPYRLMIEWPKSGSYETGNGFIPINAPEAANADISCGDGRGILSWQIKATVALSIIIYVIESLPSNTGIGK